MNPPSSLQPRAGAGVLRRRAVCLGLLAVRWGAVMVDAAGSLPSRETEAPVLLPPWVIEETVAPALRTAREDSFASTLGPTAVVAATAWSGRTVGTLAEALRRTPGVMLQESFGGFEPPRLSIRGSGLDSAPTARGVALLADGLPFARADGSFHSGLFDPLLFTRVEVYRGTMHMALTPAVLGGVLNAVPRLAGSPVGTSVRWEGGDFGQSRTQVTATSGVAHLAASLARSRGWREQSRQERGAFLAGTQAALGPATRLEFSAYLAAADYDVPGPLTLADLWSRPRTVTAAVVRDRPRRESDTTRIAAQVKSAAAAGSFAAGVAWLQLKDDFFQLQANGETDAASNDLTAHTTASRRVMIAGVEHQLLARATCSVGTNAVDRYLNTRSDRGARFGAYEAFARTAALSLEDLHWVRPDLAAGVGATVLQARRVLEDRFAPTGTVSPVARSLSVGDVSPRAGLIWHPRPNLALRLAFSRGVEPPSFDDLVAVQGAFPNLSLRSRALRAQRATTWELGAQGEWGAVAWNVTGYRGAWRDEILRLADASGLPRGAVNAGSTQHEGIESSLRWRGLAGVPSLSFAVTSTVGHFVFADDPVYGRNRLAGAPPHVGLAELAYEPARGGFAAVESTWVAGRTPVDHAGRLTYGGHALLHARVGWRAGDHWVIFLAGRNLLDRTHVASTAGVLDLARAPAATTIFLPGAGRAFTLGLTWKQ